MIKEKDLVIGNLYIKKGGEVVVYLGKTFSQKFLFYKVAQLNGYFDSSSLGEKFEIYNKDNDSNIVAFNIKGVFAQDTAIYLDKYNICVRAGNHCAKILDNVFNVSNTVRISLSFYNTKEEIDLLINVLKNSENIWKEIL